MSKRAKVQVKQAPFKDLWIACSDCGRVTCHQVLTSVGMSDQSEDGDIQVWEDYHTAVCRGCRTVTFCRQSSCSEDSRFVNGEEEFVVKSELYPARIAGRAPLEVYELPSSVREIYTEAHSALCNKLPVLAGVGLRAIVEAVCNHESIAGKDLKERINGLASRGLITTDAATILHSLRFMGNNAAHEIKPHNDVELNAAFDVIEILLQAVYILPGRARKLPSAPP